MEYTKKILNIFSRLFRKIFPTPQFLFKKDNDEIDDFLIIDNMFPSYLSNWRNLEFASYASEINKIRFICTNPDFKKGNLTYGTSFHKDLERILCFYPQLNKHKIQLIQKKNIINAKLGYCLFFSNINRYYKEFEKLDIPFVFTLYPGGGFRLYDEQIDNSLKKIFSSKYFRKVIITQPFVKEYLIINNFVEAEKIKFIYGAPMMYKDTLMTRDYFGEDRETLNICFVSVKYSPQGFDKGFDVFSKVASIFKFLDRNIKFHVVGGFSEEDEKIITGTNNITYYGYLEFSDLHNFFLKMDCIISPNRAFVLSPGAFDGFPTASVVEAALNGVMMICSDPFDVAQPIGFENHKHIEIISDRPSEIVELINFLYKNPYKIKELAAEGRRKVMDLFNDDIQLKQRVHLIKELIFQNDSGN